MKVTEKKVVKRKEREREIQREREGGRERAFSLFPDFHYFIVSAAAAFVLRTPPSPLVVLGRDPLLKSALRKHKRGVVFKQRLRLI